MDNRTMPNLKGHYSSYFEPITQKRYNSKFPIRKKVHLEMINSVLNKINSFNKLLDLGCGDGHLSLKLASKNVGEVVGLDLSSKNLEQAQKKVQDEKIMNLKFEVGAIEATPFSDDEFDIVIAHHVLEHVEDLSASLKELTRICNGKIYVAVPTCFSPCSWVLLGNGNYWSFGKSSIPRTIWGFLRMLKSLLQGQEGVNEGYQGNKKIKHIHFNPLTFKKVLEKHSLKVLKIEAQTLQIPFINFDFNFLRQTFPFKYLGLGTLYVLEKSSKH